MTEWKQAARQAKKAARSARAAEAVINKAKREAAEEARLARPVHDSAALFDGKEIKDEGGRLVGRWRYRGGGFVAVYMKP